MSMRSLGGKLSESPNLKIESSPGVKLRQVPSGQVWQALLEVPFWLVCHKYSQLCQSTHSPVDIPGSGGSLPLIQNLQRILNIWFSLSEQCGLWLCSVLHAVNSRTQRCWNVRVVRDRSDVMLHPCNKKCHLPNRSGKSYFVIKLFL